LIPIDDADGYTRDVKLMPQVIDVGVELTGEGVLASGVQMALDVNWSLH
jgi:hypothetical protein